SATPLALGSPTTTSAPTSPGGPPPTRCWISGPSLIPRRPASPPGPTPSPTPAATTATPPSPTCAGHGKPPPRRAPSLARYPLIPVIFTSVYFCRCPIFL